MKKKIKTEELDIEVTRGFMFGEIRAVRVHRQGHIVYDDIELTPKQAQQLYWSLGAILGMNTPIPEDNSSTGLIS